MTLWNRTNPKAVRLLVGAITVSLFNWMVESSLRAESVAMFCWLTWDLPVLPPWNNKETKKIIAVTENKADTPPDNNLWLERIRLIGAQRLWLPVILSLSGTSVPKIWGAYGDRPEPLVVSSWSIGESSDPILAAEAGTFATRGPMA